MIGFTEMWLQAEVRKCLAMAQRLDANTGFYDNMRLQHAAVSHAQGEVPSRSYQGAGRLVFRNLVDSLASVELNDTRAMLTESLGWVLLLDGSNKGKFYTKGELLMFRDVSPEGDIRIRCLNMVFLKKKELQEYRKLGQKPFGASAQGVRMRDAIQERFGKGPKPAAAE